MCLPDIETQTCNYQLPFPEHLLWSSGCWTIPPLWVPTDDTSWVDQLVTWRWMDVPFVVEQQFVPSGVYIKYRYSIFEVTFMPQITYHWFAEDFIFYHGIPDNIILTTEFTSVDVRWLLMFMWLTSLTIYPRNQKYVIDRVTIHLAVPKMALIYALLFPNNYSKCSFCSQNSYWYFNYSFNWETTLVSLWYYPLGFTLKSEPTSVYGAVVSLNRTLSSKDHWI